MEEFQLCSVLWGILRRANNERESLVKLDGMASIFALELNHSPAIGSPLPRERLFARD